MTGNVIDQDKAHSRQRGSKSRILLVLFVTLAMVLQSLMCGPITRGFATEDGTTVDGQEQVDEEATETAEAEAIPADAAEDVPSQTDNEADQTKNVAPQGDENDSNDTANTEDADNQATELGNDGDGTPAPDSTTDSARVVLHVHKEVAGDEFNDDVKFSFELKAVEEAPMPEAATTVEVSAGETGDFGEIAYTTAGSYYYTITEVVPEEEIVGMSYSTESVWARVDVAEDLSYQVVYGSEDDVRKEDAFTAEGAQKEHAIVVNTYTAPSETPTKATETLKVTKQVVGAPYAGDESFTFNLAAIDGAPMPESKQVSAKAGATAEFGQIVYEAAGTYYYTITEVVPDKKTLGMTYNTESVWARVDVAKDLTAAVRYGTENEVKNETATQAESAIIKNSYIDTGSIEVRKVVKSDRDDDKNRDYRFRITLFEPGKTNVKDFSGTYGDVEFNHGVAEFTLRDGQSKAARGLPLNKDGVPFTVEEIDTGGLTYDWDSNDPADGVSWVCVCTNTRTANTGSTSSTTTQTGTKTPTRTTTATTSTRAATPKTADASSVMAAVSAAVAGFAAIGFGASKRRERR